MFINEYYECAECHSFSFFYSLKGGLSTLDVKLDTSIDIQALEQQRRRVLLIVMHTGGLELGHCLIRDIGRLGDTNNCKPNLAIVRGDCHVDVAVCGHDGRGHDASYRGLSHLARHCDVCGCGAEPSELWPGKARADSILENNLCV